MFLARVGLLAVLLLGPVLGIAAGVRAYEAWGVPGVLRGPGARPVPDRPFSAEVGIVVVAIDGQPSPPADEVLLAVTAGERDSAATFYRGISNGRWRVDARILGRASVPDAGGCPIEAWASAALDQVREQHAPLDGVTNLVFALPPDPECGAAGWAETGGRVIWLIGAVPAVAVVHELAHNWGAGHATSSGCGAGATGAIGPGDGITPGGCSDEYGDPFDAMGSGWGLNVLNREAIGLIGAERIVAMDRPSRVRLPALGGSGVQGIRFPAGPGEPGDVVLELRVPGALEPADLQAPGRVLAHRPLADTGTALIDAHPDTDSLFDAGLAPGESLDLPRGLRVTVASIDEATATLEVTAR